MDLRTATRSLLSKGWLAPAIGLGVALAFLLTAAQTRQREDQAIRRMMQQESISLQSQIRARIDRHTEALVRLAVLSRPQRSDDDTSPSSIVEESARLLINDYPELRTIVLIDAAYKIRVIIPETAGYQFPSAFLRLDTVVGPVLDIARFRKQPALSSLTLDDPESENRFIIVAPVLGGFELRGFLLGIFSSRDLLSPLLLPRAASGFLVGVHENTMTVFAPFGVGNRPSTDQSSDVSLGLGTGGWDISVRPTAEFRAQQTSNLPALIATCGLILGLTAAFTVLRIRSEIVAPVADSTFDPNDQDVGAAPRQFSIVNQATSSASAPRCGAETLVVLRPQPNQESDWLGPQSRLSEDLRCKLEQSRRSDRH